MKNKRKSSKSSYIAFAVFVVFVIVSGFALKAADYIDSPFDDIAFMTQWDNGEGQSILHVPTDSTAKGETSLNSDKPQFHLPAVGDLNAGTTSGDKPQFQLPAVNDLNASDSSDDDSSSEHEKPQFQLPVVSDLNAGTTSGDKPQFQLPPVSAVTDHSQNAAIDTGVTPGPNNQDDINWSEAGGVFYDFWFICAVSAVFIVVQYVFKFTLKRIKNPVPATAATK